MSDIGMMRSPLPIEMTQLGAVSHAWGASIFFPPPFVVAWLGIGLLTKGRAHPICDTT